MTVSKMTKGERTELSALIRKREKVMRSAIQERSAQMMADFDRQSAEIFKFDDDAIWKQATEAAAEAVKKANEIIAKRCKALGIPSEFAPGVSFGWYGRGENASSERRAELRRAARSKVDQLEKAAFVQIEKISLQAQTEVIESGLQSEAAKMFLEKMPKLDVLMPVIDAREIKALIDQRHAKRTQSSGYGGVYDGDN